MEFVRYVTHEELNSNINQLFNRTFMVKVAYIDLMDTNELQRYGYVTSGDDEDDRCNAHEKITVALTIPKLLEMYKNQTPFYLFSSSDEHIMYNIIANHIHDWKVYVENAFNLDIVPYSDLVDLSEFANAIYKSRDRDLDVVADINTIHNAFGHVEGLLSISDILLPKENTLKEKPEDKAPHLADSSILDEVFTKRGTW